MIVVVDTNILFSALLKTPNKFAETIFLSDDTFHAPAQVVFELFRHRYKIMKASHLDDDVVFELLSLLAKRINIVEERKINDAPLQKAYALCKEIDVEDTIIVALALQLEAHLWTGDKKLLKGLTAKGFDKFYTVK